MSLVQKYAWVSTITLLGMIPNSSFASYVHTGNKCDLSLPILRTPSGVCGNRVVPLDRARNARGFSLSCSSNSDHHIRGPVSMDPKVREEWEMQEQYSRMLPDPEERIAALWVAHNIAVSQPKIEWKGTIPYQTVENWTWTSCETHQNSSICGSHEDPETCYRTETKQDANGNTYTESVPYTCYVSHANYCDYDQDESASWGCSNEVMDFHAEFAKPGPDWVPPKNDDDLKARKKRQKNQETKEGRTLEHLQYNALIPNKYDLLPGELEDIQVFNSGRFSSTLSPTVEIGDAWNHYSHSVEFRNGGGSTASCRYQTRYAINVVIYTKGRDNTRQTPNAFRIPTDEEGKKEDPFTYLHGFVNDKMVNVRPQKLRLVDASNTVLDVMSKQLRTAALAVEEAKDAAGLGSTGTIDDANMSADSRKSFFKNTRLRIQLIEKNYAFGADLLARDKERTPKYYGGGALLTVDGDFWTVPLDQRGYSHLYKGNGPGFTNKYFNQVDVELKPGTEYLYFVSMYQEGIPFYAQKGQKGQGWNEFLKGEDAYFSKPLILKFSSPKDFDARSLFDKAADY